MNLVHITINGKRMEVDRRRPLLHHARQHGFDIPTLCHDDRLTPYPSCYLCVVEVDKAAGLVASCARYPEEGMVVETDNERVLKARRRALSLLASDHYANCVPPCKFKKKPGKFVSLRRVFSARQSSLPVCAREVGPDLADGEGMRLFDPPAPDCSICQCSKMAHCEFRKLAIKYDVMAEDFGGEFNAHEPRALNPRLGLDMNKCIRCAKCIRACRELEGVGILEFVNRGFNMELCYIAYPEIRLSECMQCIASGATCVEICPTGALELLEPNADSIHEGSGE